ncbi:MAG: zinc ribbon domain-containing protein [Chloracidobacterium sp.]|nr:zinc ribbon domain-containing protein [Chloracidobacterium sp.]
MFCPKCGSNQGEGKRFCTVCGTNLAAVSQALTGRLSQPNFYAPPIPHPLEIARQRVMANGVRLTIIGGGFVAWKLFEFMFYKDFSGSPFGFWSFIGFIMLAVGISKIIASRPPGGVAAAPNVTPSEAPHLAHSMRHGDPSPYFSTAVADGAPVPQTSELEAVGRQAASVTEDETRHLPHAEPPQEIIR